MIKISHPESLSDLLLQLEKQGIPTRLIKITPAKVIEAGTVQVQVPYEVYSKLCRNIADHIVKGGPA